MTRSTKLGLTGILLLLLTTLPPYENWKQPINAACLILAFVLGYLAANNGSRWWLLLCGFIFSGVALLLWVGFHAI